MHLTLKDNLDYVAQKNLEPSRVYRQLNYLFLPLFFLLA
jgi:hypothetical protein